MVRAFLWVIIAVLAGAIAWLLFVGGPSGEPIEKESGEAPALPQPDASSVSAPSARPAPQPSASSESASEEQLRLRRLILSGNYAAPKPAERPEPAADVLVLKKGKKLQGKIISESTDAILFQVEGEKPVQRIPRKDILRTSTALMEAARSSARGGAKRPDVLSDGEKAELRMTPEEYQKHLNQKRVERLERHRREGGIPAINIAKDLKKKIEDKNRGIQAIQKKE